MVVTARKWQEPEARVPSSVTVLDRDQLRDGGILTVREAAARVPNTVMSEFTSRRLSFPFVRGIGSGQGDPAVATFYDGVPQLTVSSTNLPLLDIERVEFLRGSHGVLHGRNTIGGAIYINSRRPTDRLEGDAGLTVGDFGRQDYRFAVSGPVTEDGSLAFRLTGLHSVRDGYTVNDFTGNDIDSREGAFGRAQILWRPDDESEVRFIVHGERARDGGFALTDLTGLRQRPGHLNQDFEGSADRDLVGVSMVWERFSADSDFTSITSVQDWRISEISDFDFSIIDGVRRFTDEEQTYVYQELRLASHGDGDSLGSSTRLRWVAGISGFFSDSSRSAANEFRPGGVPILFPPASVGTDRATGQFEDIALAVFGQGTVAFDGGWELTGALRYDYESKDADLTRVFETGGFTIPIGGANRSEHYDEILPRVSLARELGKNASAYILAARGFKAGGFNLTAPAGLEAFGPETSWTYEAGVKATALHGDLYGAFSLFWIDWQDMQLSQFDMSAGGFVTNAGESRSAGVELELAGRPGGGLELFGAFGLLDTEFDRFVDSFGQDVSGRNLPFAPDNTATVGAQYRFDLRGGGSLFARAELNHVGEFFYDAGNRGAERYSLVNFRLGGGGDSWRLEAWLHNAFDEDYVSVAFQPNPADPTAFVGERAAPRTFGVSFSIVF